MNRARSPRAPRRPRRSDLSVKTIQRGRRPEPEGATIQRTVLLQPPEMDVCDKAYECLFAANDGQKNTIVIPVNARSAKMAGIYYDLRRRYFDDKHGCLATVREIDEFLADSDTPRGGVPIEAVISQNFTVDTKSGELIYRDPTMRQNVMNNDVYPVLKELSERITWQLPKKDDADSGLTSLMVLPERSAREWYLPIGMEEEIAKTLNSGKEVNFGVLSGFGLPVSQQDIVYRVSLLAERVSDAVDKPFIAPFVNFAPIVRDQHAYTINFVAAGAASDAWSILPEFENKLTSEGIFQALLVSGTWNLAKREWDGSLIFAIPGPLYDPVAGRDLIRSYEFGNAIDPIVRRFVGESVTGERLDIELVYGSDISIRAGEINFQYKNKKGDLENYHMDVFGGSFIDDRLMLNFEFEGSREGYFFADNGETVRFRFPPDLGFSRLENIELRRVAPRRTLVSSGGHAYVFRGVEVFLAKAQNAPEAALGVFASNPTLSDSDRVELQKMIFTLRALDSIIGRENEGFMQTFVSSLFDAKYTELDSIQRHDDPDLTMASYLGDPESLPLSDDLNQIVNSNLFFIGFADKVPEERSIPVYVPPGAMPFAVTFDPGYQADVITRLGLNTGRFEKAYAVTPDNLVYEIEEVEGRYEFEPANLVQAAVVLKQELARRFSAVNMLETYADIAYNFVQKQVAAIVNKVGQLRVELRGNYAYDLRGKEFNLASKDTRVKYFMDPFHFYGDPLYVREIALRRQNFTTKYYLGQRAPTFKLLSNAVRGALKEEIERKNNELSVDSVVREYKAQKRTSEEQIRPSRITELDMTIPSLAVRYAPTRRDVVPLLPTKTPRGSFPSPIVSVQMSILKPAPTAVYAKWNPSQKDIVEYFKAQGHSDFVKWAEIELQKEIKTVVINRELNVEFKNNQNAALSTRFVRPFEFCGITFNSIDHAFRTLKAGKFNPNAYESPNVEYRFPVNPDFSSLAGLIFVDILRESLRQNPEAQDILGRLRQVPTAKPGEQVLLNTTIVYTELLGTTDETKKEQFPRYYVGSLVNQLGYQPVPLRARMEVEESNLPRSGWTHLATRSQTHAFTMFDSKTFTDMGGVGADPYASTVTVAWDITTPAGENGLKVFSREKRLTSGYTIVPDKENQLEKYFKYVREEKKKLYVPKAPPTVEFTQTYDRLALDRIFAEMYEKGLARTKGQNENPLKMPIRFALTGKRRQKMIESIVQGERAILTRYPTEAIRYMFNKGETRIGQITSGNEVIQIPVFNLGRFTWEQAVKFFGGEQNYLTLENVGGNLPKLIDDWKNDAKSVRNIYVIDKTLAQRIRNSSLLSAGIPEVDVQFVLDEKTPEVFGQAFTAFDAYGMPDLRGPSKAIFHSTTPIAASEQVFKTTLPDNRTLYLRSRGEISFKDYLVELQKSHPEENAGAFYADRIGFDADGVTDPNLRYWYEGRIKLTLLEVSDRPQFNRLDDVFVYRMNPGNALIKYFIDQYFMAEGQNATADFKISAKVTVDLNLIKLVCPDVPTPVKLSNDLGVLDLRIRALPRLSGSNEIDPYLLEILDGLDTPPEYRTGFMAYSYSAELPERKAHELNVDNLLEIDEMLPPPSLQEGSFFFVLAENVGQSDPSFQRYPEFHQIGQRANDIIARVKSGQLFKAEIPLELAALIPTANRVGLYPGKKYGLFIGDTSFVVDATEGENEILDLTFKLRGKADRDVTVALADLATKYGVNVGFESPKTREQVNYELKLRSGKDPTVYDVELNYLKNLLDLYQTQAAQLAQVQDNALMVGEYQHAVDTSGLQQFLEQNIAREANAMNKSSVPEEFMEELAMTGRKARSLSRFGKGYLQELALTNSSRYGRRGRGVRGMKQNPGLTQEQVEAIVRYRKERSQALEGPAKAALSGVRPGPFSQAAIGRFFPREGIERPSDWQEEKRLRAGLADYDLITRTRGMTDEDMIEGKPYTFAAREIVEADIKEADPFFKRAKGLDLVKAQAELSLEDVAGILEQQKAAVERRGALDKRLTIQASSAVCKNFRQRRLNNYSVPRAITQQVLDYLGGSVMNSILVLMSPKYVGRDQSGNLIPNNLPRVMTWRRGDHIDCDMTGRGPGEMIDLLGKSLQSAMLWLGEKPDRRTMGKGQTALFISRVGDPFVYIAWKPGDELTLQKVTENLQDPKRAIAVVYNEREADNDVNAYVTAEGMLNRGFSFSGRNESASKASAPPPPSPTPVEPETKQGETELPAALKPTKLNDFDTAQSSINYKVTGLRAEPASGSEFIYRHVISGILGSPGTEVPYRVKVKSTKATGRTFTVELEATKVEVKSNPRRRRRR